MNASGYESAVDIFLDRNVRSPIFLTYRYGSNTLLLLIGETMKNRIDLLQGTLEILILKAVSLGPLHGYGILMRIQQISGGRLQIPQGSFYVAVYRIEYKGWLKGEWGESENNRRAKFYRLTAAGRRQLESETQKWSEMTDVIHGILNATPEQI